MKNKFDKTKKKYILLKMMIKQYLVLSLLYVSYIMTHYGVFIKVLVDPTFYQVSSLRNPAKIYTNTHKHMHQLKMITPFQTPFRIFFNPISLKDSLEPDQIGSKSKPFSKIKISSLQCFSQSQNTVSLQFNECPLLFFK